MCTSELEECWEGPPEHKLVDMHYRYMYNLYIDRSRRRIRAIIDHLTTHGRQEIVQIYTCLYSEKPLGHYFMAVLERWVFNRDANIGHYITSDLSRWL